MSINVGQVFVQHEKLNLIIKVAAEYLRMWQRDVYSRLSDIEKNEQGAEHFLEKRTRKITVLPPKGGWTTLIECVRFLADAELAKHLSEGLGCRTVWAEVQGGALGWACFEFEKGALVRGRMEPLAGREPRLVAAANEAGLAGLTELESADMPDYPADPERAAWDHLVGLGLPAEHLFVYPSDLTRLDSGGDITAGFLTLKESSFYNGRLITALGPARFPRRTGSLPCRPDLVARTGGEPVAVHEVRLLAGRPRPAALDAAFTAELIWRRRALVSLSASSPGRLPEILFRYKNPERPDVDLDAEMERRRSASRSPIIRLTSAKDLLARRGFAARAAAVLNARQASLEAKPDEVGDLCVTVDGQAATVSLFAAHRRYLAAPETLEAQAGAAFDEFLADRAQLAGLSPASVARLAVLVRPSAAVPPDAVSAALGVGLAAVAAVGREGGFTLLPRAALAKLGLTEVEALSAAKKNLEEACSGMRPAIGTGAFSPLPAPAGMPAASVLAWPGLAGRLSEALGGGQAVVAAPSSGAVFFAPQTSAGDSAYRAALSEDFDLAAEPVSDRVLRPSAQGLEAV
ncbi:MAG TPA: hypothetical protein PK280_10885 [Planctomycetota bacterium]|nr:hypothetical protein [Planctomycetota bacterium]